MLFKYNPELSGYIYCLQIFDLNMYKIGMTKNSKEKLLIRYKTTYPINKLLLFNQVNNRYDAEKLLLFKIKNFRINNSEVVCTNFQYINETFKEVSKEYPSLNSCISQMSVSELTQYNNQFRKDNRSN